MNMSLGQKKIYRKRLTKYDIIQHVTESSERVIFITNLCSVRKGFLREKKIDHYSPNEIFSMIYETHVSRKVQPLSRAVCLKRDIGFGERNQSHIIPQPIMHMFNSKLVSFGKDSAKLSFPAAKYVTSVAVHPVSKGQLPHPLTLCPRPCSGQALILPWTVWPLAAEGQEQILLGGVLSPHPLPAWRSRQAFPAWRDPTWPTAPGAGRARRGVWCAPD